MGQLKSQTHLYDMAVSVRAKSEGIGWRNGLGKVVVSVREVAASKYLQYHKRLDTKIAVLLRSSEQFAKILTSIHFIAFVGAVHGDPNNPGRDFLKSAPCQCGYKTKQPLKLYAHAGEKRWTSGIKFLQHIWHLGRGCSGDKLVW